MEQGKGLIVGIDMENTITQAAVYDAKSSSVQSVNLSQDSREYVNPVPLKDIISGNDGTDADSLTRILNNVIAECMRVTNTTEVLSVCISFPYFYMDALNALREAVRRTGIKDGRWQIISKTESFAYYSYSQKRELSSSGVALIEYDEDGIHCVRLGVRKIDNVSYLLQENVEYTSENIKNVVLQRTGLESVEEELCRFAEEYFLKRPVSAAYLTGTGFDVAELPPKFAKLMVTRRKAFVGQNLFSKGACYAAMELLKPELFKNVELLLDNRVKYGIEMDISQYGQAKRFRIVREGTNWYMIDRTMEFVLDDIRTITLRITTPDKRYYDEDIDISEIPFREGKTTRISMNVRFSGVDRCLICIKDKGFGDFYKSSGKVIYKELEFKNED